MGRALTRKFAIGVFGFLVLSNFGLYANATTSFYFSPNSDIGIVFLDDKGKAEDVDAVELFSTMNVSSNPRPTTLEKIVDYQFKGARALEIKCYASIRRPGSSTCAFLIGQTAVSKVDPAAGIAILHVTDPTEAQALANLFRTPTIQGLIYQSGDQKVKIEVVTDSTGSVTEFNASMKE